MVMMRMKRVKRMMEDAEDKVAVCLFRQYRT